MAGSLGFWGYVDHDTAYVVTQDDIVLVSGMRVSIVSALWVILLSVGFLIAVFIKVSGVFHNLNNNTLVITRF